MVSICKDLHKQIADTEEAKYDLEMKIRNKYQFKPINLKIKAGLTLGDHTHKEDKTGNLL